MHSLTWRRRFFHLHGDALRMYKSDGEVDKPLTVAPLGRGAVVSHTYEESQVRGSWKLRSGSGEVSGTVDMRSGRLGGTGRALADFFLQEYFMFADSAEDKDAILEGLTIAIG